LAQETSIPDQIAAVLSSGARTVKDLAAELGMEDKPNQVRSILNKNKGRFIQVETNLGAPHWGIAHHD